MNSPVLNKPQLRARYRIDNAVMMEVIWYSKGMKPPKRKKKKSKMNLHVLSFFFDLTRNIPQFHLSAALRNVKCANACKRE